MPLIIISGYPSAGKTYRSKQLLGFLKSKVQSSADARTRQLLIHHINEETLGLDRDVYREAKQEKDARAAEYSAIKRLLGPDAIVIADGLNYIKGFRYQLYCDSKAAKTPSCVVHVGTPIEKCREINTSLLTAEDGDRGGYPNDIFEDLVYRYEEPNGMNRWDSPLFTVPYNDEAPPFDAIWEAIVGSGEVKTAKPNLATVSAPATESDHLYELGKVTQAVLNLVLQWQKDHPGEGEGEVSTPDGTVKLPPNAVSVAKLQRIRRQFISLNRQHRIPGARVRSSFIEYLNDSLD